MFHEIKVSFNPINHRVTRRLVDFDRHSGPELSHTQHGINVFKSDCTSAAEVLGMAAIADISTARIPPGVVLQGLREINIAAVIFLGVLTQSWDFTGPPEFMKRARSWIGEEAGAARRRRIEELFNVQERPANRFMAVGRDYAVRTFSDAGAALEKPGYRFAAQLDAHAYASELQSYQPVGLFRLEPKAEF